MANNENEESITNINDVAENLVELLTTSVNLTDAFYDLFFNPEPLDVTLQRYNKDNELVTVTIPNRAKDRRIAIVGEGNPEGIQVAVAGTIYVDKTNNGSIYIKSTESGKTGWRVVNIFPSTSGSSDSYLYTDGSNILWRPAGTVGYDIVTETSSHNYEVQLKDVVTNDVLTPITTGANRDLSNLTNKGIDYLKDVNTFMSGNNVSGENTDWHYNYIVYNELIGRKTNNTGTDTYTVNGSTISIPYTLSTAGEKFVASANKSSVFALYNAIGYSPYYVIDANDSQYKFQLPMGTPYGFITNVDNNTKIIVGNTDISKVGDGTGTKTIKDLDTLTTNVNTNTSSISTINGNINTINGNIGTLIGGSKNISEVGDGTHGETIYDLNTLTTNVNTLTREVQRVQLYQKIKPIILSGLDTDKTGKVALDEQSVIYSCDLNNVSKVTLTFNDIRPLIRVGYYYTFEVYLSNVQANTTITFKSFKNTDIQWAGGEAPTIDSTGGYWFVFRCNDTSNNANNHWMGNLQGRW